MRLRRLRLSLGCMGTLVALGGCGAGEVVTPCTPNWQCQLPLNGNESDGCGNSRANAACTVDPEPVDAPPNVSIVTPADGATVSTPTITVEGNAADDIRVSKVEVKVGAGGWQLASGTTSWSMAVTLALGSNTIDAQATDSSGKTKAASATVTYEPSVGPRAFPEAQGAGAESVGGRGGRVIYVTNLDSEGPGSLREAMESSGPRIVAFKVGGVIHLQKTAANPGGYIYVTKPFLTVAGQTAPGGGITIQGNLQIQAHDVVLRFITIRLGNATGNSNLFGTAIAIGGGAGSSVIVDHVSISWAHDDSLQFWGTKRVEKFTFSWNLIAEGLRDPTYHSSQGMIFGGSTVEAINSGNFDVHHNALMKFGNRFPATKIKDLRITNNLLYYALWEMTMLFGGVEADIVGNIYKRVPEKKYEVKVYGNPDGVIDNGVPGYPSIYIVGNKGPHQPNPDDDNWPMVDGGDTHPSWKRPAPLPPPKYPVTVHSTAVLEQLVLEDVGNSRRLDENGNWVSRRDAVDTRLINEYTTNTGIQPEQTSNSVPWDASEVGGWPTIEPGTPYADTDSDGMPDAWEASHGLDPNNPADASQDTDADGYTNIEEFLNGIP